VIIAIDGPSGAGKSTLARRLAQELGYIYLDTGAMYRALALKLLRQGVDLADDTRMAELVQSTAIDLRDNDGKLAVLLDGADVGGEIRAPEVSQMASKSSALKIVRARLLELQRAVGKRGRRLPQRKMAEIEAGERLQTRTQLRKLNVRAFVRFLYFFDALRCLG